MFRQSMSTLGSKVAPAAFVQALQTRGCDSYYGVPDSLLKDLCAYLTTNVSDPAKHVITANEGNAVAMAAGHHLASSKVPVVYMQNSGIGNAVNPLLSLAHRQVYRIPMLLLIGWRGDPGGKSDEPQHLAQGRLLEDNLNSCEVPYSVLAPGDNVETALSEALDNAFSHFAAENTPYAILIKRDTFEAYKPSPSSTGATGSDSGSGRHQCGPPDLALTREAALELLVGSLSNDDIVVSTTGMPSRELFEIRAKNKSGHHRDFLTVGSMGHCSSIAGGIALAKPDRTVYCVDGDGASIMHLGSYAINGGLSANHNVSIGRNLLDNMKHIVLNNGAHDSVGGQPTVGFDVALSDVASACGYNVVCPTPCTDIESTVKGLQLLKEAPAGKGPCFLEILVKKGNRKDLGRPTVSPQDNKKAFMTFVQEEQEP